MSASALPSRTFPAITTVAVVLSLLLIVTAAACEQNADKTKTFDYHLKHSKVFGKPEIVIGVAPAVPMMSFKDPKTGMYSGFDIDIARSIAEDLGFSGDDKIDWHPLTTEKRETVLNQGVVDLVVASYSITPPRENEGIRFAGPYMITTQEVLIPTHLKDVIKEISDLKKKEVKLCVPGDSTSEKEWRERGIPVEVLSSDQECIDRIIAGQFSALSTDRTILEGFKYAYSERPEKYGYDQRFDFTVLDLPLGQDEKLGVGVRTDDPSLEYLVGDILLENYKRGTNSRWQRAYDNNLLAALGPMKQPPLNEIDLISHEDRSPPARSLARPLTAMSIRPRSRPETVR